MGRLRDRRAGRDECEFPYAWSGSRSNDFLVKTASRKVAVARVGVGAPMSSTPAFGTRPRRSSSDLGDSQAIIKPVTVGWLHVRTCGRRWSELVARALTSVSERRKLVGTEILDVSTQILCGAPLHRQTSSGVDDCRCRWQQAEQFGHDAES